MAKHIFKGITAPGFAPRQAGHHYVNTANGDMYISKGFATPADWVLLSQSIDDMVKISTADTTPGYLDSELTVDNGTNATNPLEKSITSPAANEKLNLRFDQTKLSLTSSQITDFNEAAQDVAAGLIVGGTGITVTYNDPANTLTIAASGAALIDEKVKISATDTTANYLSAEMAAGTGLTKTILNPAGDEQLEYKITNTAVTAASYGSATQVPSYTVNAQGQLTAAANVAIAIPSTAITDFAEAVDDRVSVLVVGGTGITSTYNDGANTLTIAATTTFDSSREAVGTGWEDFVQGELDGTTSEPYGFQELDTNGGVVDIIDSATGNDFLGQASMITGTTFNSTGFASIISFSNTGKLVLGGLRTVMETRVRVPTLGASNPAYEVVAGMMTPFTTILPSSGVFFYYHWSTNSGQWRCVCRNSSVSTNNDSTVAVTANTWFKLRIDINAAATSVLFYIDDVQIGSAVTTNIPTSALVIGAGIEKTNLTSTSREFDVDYFYWKVFR